MALQFALLAAIAVVGLLTRGSWPEPVQRTAGVLGAALLVAGAVGAVLALTGLGSALTAVPAPLEGERLRTGGIYAVVRHPIYGSLILMSVGFALLTNPWALLVALLLAVELDLKRRVEEEFLSAAYPDYAEYRRAVPHVLVPGVW